MIIWLRSHWPGRRDGDPTLHAASQAFARERLDFYANLADLLSDTDGRTNLLHIFLRDAQRYQGSPRGTLSRHWADIFESSGASLAATWDGTLPPEEVMLIRVAEQGGAQATISALRDLARVGAVVQSCRHQFLLTIASGLVAAAITLAMLLAMPYLFVPFLQSAFGFIPATFLGLATRSYFATAQVVSWVWPALLLLFVGSLVWLRWALPGWTGTARERADDSVLVFRLYRDFKGSLFLAMFAALTQSRCGAATPQRDALLLMHQAATPWLAWKIRAILERIDDQGALDARVLDVGVVDQDVYHLFADIFEARGVAAGLQAAGLRSEQRAQATIAQRSRFLRWFTLGTSVLLMIVMVIWLDVVVYEFKNAMLAYTQSR